MRRHNDLSNWGYAPGYYSCKCVECKVQHVAAKRSWRCLTCATKLRTAEHEKEDEMSAQPVLLDNDPTARGFMMNFGEAIARLKEGRRVARAGWNGANMYLELQTPDEHSKMTLPYIYMRTVQGDLVPWLASQTDMLSEDWVPIYG